MALLEVVMFLLLFGGLVGAIVAARRRSAGWLLLACLALAVGSVPLLLGGIGVFGIAAALVLMVVARALPEYSRYRWIVRAFAVAGVVAVVALQGVGWGRGIVPSAVDWILVALSAGFLGVSLLPVRTAPGPVSARPEGWNGGVGSADPGDACGDD